jgi:hypothetical protein
MLDDADNLSDIEKSMDVNNSDVSKTVRMKMIRTVKLRIQSFFFLEKT